MGGIRGERARYEGDWGPAESRSGFGPATARSRCGDRESLRLFDDAPSSEEAAVLGKDLPPANRLQSIPNHDQRLDRFGQHQRFFLVLEAGLVVPNRRVVPVDADAVPEI